MGAEVASSYSIVAPTGAADAGGSIATVPPREASTSRASVSKLRVSLPTGTCAATPVTSPGTPAAVSPLRRRSASRRSRTTVADRGRSSGFSPSIPRIKLSRSSGISRPVTTSRIGRGRVVSLVWIRAVICLLLTGNRPETIS